MGIFVCGGKKTHQLQRKILDPVAQFILQLPQISQETSIGLLVPDKMPMRQTRARNRAVCVSLQCLK